MLFVGNFPELKSEKDFILARVTIMFEFSGMNAPVVKVGKLRTHGELTHLGTCSIRGAGATSEFAGGVKPFAL